MNKLEVCHTLVLLLIKILKCKSYDKSIYHVDFLKQHMLTKDHTVTKVKLQGLTSARLIFGGATANLCHFIWYINYLGCYIKSCEICSAT